MKKQFATLGLFVLVSGFSLTAQSVTTAVTQTKEALSVSRNVPTVELNAPNLEQLRKEDAERDRDGALYRIGIATYTHLSTDNSGLWSSLPDGSRLWQLKIKFSGAEALSFLFSRFDLADGAVFSVNDLKGTSLHKELTKADMQEDLQQNIALCFGDEMVLTLKEPKSATHSSLLIDRVVYNYRSTGNPAVLKINESASCEVNVNCSPVGNNWQDEKRGVARIYIVDGGSAGWCTGSLVNNTALDCKPLFLTALHCGVSTTSSDSNLWRFYFRYEATGCTNPTSTGTLANNYITGCVRLANSNDNGGDTGSDFLLVQLGTIANQSATVTTLKSAAFNAYWNGWDANNTTTSSAVGIHHPAGDIKKISTSGATSSTSWGGTTSNTHWQVTWVSNSNGYGVTEGGSSGSPLFNSLGRQIGTLTGGGSYCNAQTSPDSYGKLSYDWISNGTAAAQRLKTYLDPGATGLLVLDGSSNPCGTVVSACSDTYEANNTLATAVTVTPNTTINPYIGTSTDVDYFKFSNTAANPYIRVTLSNLPADYDLYLYNSSGTLLSSSTNGGTTNDVVTYNTTTVGVYTVRVKGYNNAYSSTACYALLPARSATTFKSAIAEPIATNGKTPESMFQVIPNPVNDGQVVIRMTDELQGTFTISIHDASGRLMQQQVVSKEEGVFNAPLEVSDLIAGVYFIYINGESLQLMEKLLITK